MSGHDRNNETGRLRKEQPVEAATDGDVENRERERAERFLALHAQFQFRIARAIHFNT